MTWGARDLEVRYGDVVAVRGVSLEAPTGAVVALVGGDGAGKTTVLRALAGAVRPARGEVRMPEAARIGYVPAGPGVYPDLTVDENLAFAAAAYGVTDSGGRTETLLERTGLRAARGRLAANLSGGMRHKLAFAAAVVHEPDLLLLDEATTGLDPVSRSELWRLIASAAAGGAAVVVATSYLEEAERCEHVSVLDEGTTLVSGTPEDVVAGIPGAVYEAGEAPLGLESWRRGETWRVWSPDGHPVEGARRVEADLEDAVVVAALARASRTREVA